MKQRFLVSACAVFYLFCGNWSNANEKAVDPLCGPRCLVRICELNKVPATLDEICGLSGYDKYNGTSMYGLYRAALQKGLAPVPLKLNLDGLRSVKFPCIAFINGNHFRVIRGIRKDEVTLQDPPDPPYLEALGIFTSEWKGEVLVFSEVLSEQLGPVGANTGSRFDGPRINLLKERHNFGEVVEGDTLKYAFRLYNNGREPLKINARSNCGCIKVAARDVIPPGGEGEIAVSFLTGGRKGYVEQSVFVQSNDPHNRLTKLTLGATILPTINILPERIWLGKVGRNETITRTVRLVDCEGEDVDFLRIVTPENIEAAVIRDTGRDSGTVSVNLVIHTGNDPGEIDQSVVFLTNDLKRPRFLLPITGSVDSGVDVFPPKVFFGEIAEGGTAQKEIILSLHTDADLELMKGTWESPYIEADLKPIEEGREYKLIVFFQAPRSRNVVRDTIPVYLKGSQEPIVKIPLFAQVVQK